MLKNSLQATAICFVQDMRTLNCRDGNGNTLDRGLYIPTASEGGGHGTKKFTCTGRYGYRC